MAAKWLVNQKDNQLSFDGLAELVAVAKEGRVVAGDLVQPPGASDWVYANEIPELKSVVKDDTAGMSETGRTVMVLAACAFFAVLTLVGVAIAAFAYLQLPDGTDLIVGGEHGLAWEEMLVTQHQAPLYQNPDPGSPSIGTLDKDAVVDLVAKQNKSLAPGGTPTVSMWKVRTKDGREGWVSLDAVLPAYQLGSKDVLEKYDPVFNPEKYVQIGNAAWDPVPDSPTKSVFRFMITNASKHQMTGVKLAAIVKDDKGAELERFEFAVEGIIPPASETGSGQTFVGSIPSSDAKDAPPRILTETTFRELAVADPAIQTKWTEGVTFEMKNKEFSAATIDIIGVEAVPNTFVGKPVPAKGEVAAPAPAPSGH